MHKDEIHIAKYLNERICLGEMVCSICGKTQSRGYADYPLSEEHQNERICIGCHNKQQAIKEAENRECVANEINSFMGCIESGKASPAASEWILKTIKLLEESPGISLVKRSQQIQETRKREFEEIKKNMMLTTGYSFDGFRIIKYLDVIFDEKLEGMGLFKGIASTIDVAFVSLTGEEATVASQILNDVKSETKKSLISKAAELGANAIIGIAYEGFSLGSIIAVAITGTAVIIEKIAEKETKEKDS